MEAKIDRRWCLAELRCGVLAALVMFAAVFPCEAEQREKVCVYGDCFNPSAVVGGVSLPIIGATRFRYLFLNIYSIALYGPAGTNTIDEILADVPKRLVLRYHRRFTRNQIVKGGLEMMKKNPEVNLSAIADAVSQMDALYMEAVHEEDEYEVSYVPGQGTSLYFNEELRGTVSGADFARAYFGIWLSKTPIDEEMRDALLGAK
jgi:hypothetical protein